MPVRTSAPAGAPCWIDLMSSDPEKAKDFYARLFGWTFHDSGPEYGNYVIFFKNDQPVAGMGRNDGESGYPDVWSTYLASDDAQATADAAAAAGGQVLMGPMQVGDQGTMAILADPSGAAIGVWQSGENTGYRIYGEAGSPVWHELSTRHYDAAVKFYRDVFNWDTDIMSDTPDFRYTTLGSGDNALAGIFDAATGQFSLPTGVPSNWQIYLGVEDVDATLAQVTALGGQILRPAWDSPYGRMAQVTDPTGAVFMISSI